MEKNINLTSNEKYEDLLRNLNTIKLLKEFRKKNKWYD